MIIEITEFKLVDGVSDEAFLEAHNRVHHEWVILQPGLVRRETIKSSDGVWRDVVMWESEESLHEAVSKILSEPGNLEWMGMIAPESIKMHHGNIMTQFT